MASECHAHLHHGLPVFLALTLPRATPCTCPSTSAPAASHLSASHSKHRCYPPLKTPTTPGEWATSEYCQGGGERLRDRIRLAEVGRRVELAPKAWTQNAHGSSSNSPQEVEPPLPHHGHRTNCAEGLPEKSRPRIGSESAPGCRSTRQPTDGQLKTYWIHMGTQSPVRGVDPHHADS